MRDFSREIQNLKYVLRNFSSMRSSLKPIENIITMVVKKFVHLQPKTSYIEINPFKSWINGTKNIAVIPILNAPVLKIILPHSLYLTLRPIHRVC